MKRVFMILFLFLAFFAPVSISHADDGGGSGTSFDKNNDFLWEKPEAKQDEKGHVLNGYIKIENRPTDDIQDYIEYTIDDSEGGFAYLVKSVSNGYIRYLIYADPESKYMSMHSYSYRKYQGELTNSSNKEVGFSVNGVLIASNPANFATNLPIFNEDDQESIDNYVNDGDYSGAENAEDVDKDFSDDPEYDEDIPMPHNLKVIQGVDQTGGTQQTKLLANFNKDVVISWTQDDRLEGMQYDVDVAFSVYRIPDDNYSEIREISTAYKSIAHESYDHSSTNVTVQLSFRQLNKLKDNGYLSKLYIRVRNKKDGKCSNWARVTINIQDKTAVADETNADSDGPDTDDEQTSDEYNGDDANAENGGGSSNIGIGPLMAYIRSGFGLLGDTGIIALMSSCFLYLPASIWTMLKFLVAMMIAITIIGLVKDVVT